MIDRERGWYRGHIQPHSFIPLQALVGLGCHPVRLAGTMPLAWAGIASEPHGAELQVGKVRQGTDLMTTGDR